MSSLTDARPRARVLRGTGTYQAAPALQTDLGAASAAVGGFDPKQVEDALRAGYREGYEAGRAAGTESARAEEQAAAATRRRAQRAELDRALAALAAAAAELDARAALDLDELAGTIAGAAVDLAEAILGREVACSPTAGRDALARALDLTPPGVAAVARLHPDDAAAVGDPASIDPGRPVTVVADPAVERGGCLVEAGDCRVDAQLGPALARARAALLGEVAA
jgi:flagellar assembly protein FliH